ncbi:MAG: hypothetical protein WCF84_26705 [Anaerolineae bacterium]
MSGRHGSKSTVIVNQFDLSGKTSSFDSSVTIEVVEDQGMGGVVAKGYTPGPMSWKKTQKGFFESDPLSTTKIAEILESLKGTLCQTIFTPGWTATEGKIAKAGQAWLSDFNIPSTNSSLVGAQVTYQGNIALARCKVLGNATKTAGANGTAFDFGAAGTAGVESYLAVTAFTGTNATFKVQSSADGSTGWADRVTHTVVSGLTYERLVSGTTVDRWLRYALTGTLTSISFVIVARPVGVFGWAAT